MRDGWGDEWGGWSGRRGPGRESGRAEEAGPAAAAATRAAAAAAGKQERIAGSSSQLEPVSQPGQFPARPVLQSGARVATLARTSAVWLSEQ